MKYSSRKSTLRSLVDVMKKMFFIIVVVIEASEEWFSTIYRISSIRRCGYCFIFFAVHFSAATICGRRFFCSELPILQLLFERRDYLKVVSDQRSTVSA